MKRILIHNIQRSAKDNPNGIAFKQLSQTVTYQQLLNKSCSLANFLIEKGVKKGDRVGVFMNRSIESSYGIYGILAAGAAYVPIDTKLPNERILHLLNDCGISILLTNGANSKNLQELVAENHPLKTVIGLKENSIKGLSAYTWDHALSMASDLPNIDYLEEDIAYIIYTSGTTGQPKGIVHTNFSGFSYAKLSAELYELDETDILGNHSHLHYDISTLGYLTMPYVGGTTIIIPEAHILFPASLSKLIESEKMTIWYSVPLALITLYQNGGLEERNLSNLKWILFGGESFSVNHIQNLFKYFPHCSFSNVYGPAEVNQCSFYHFNKETKLSDTIPLGIAWPETKFKILQEGSKTGELIVSSSTRMKGYWNKPELTQSKFVSYGDVSDSSNTYYKTGDNVKQLEDGSYEFLGRLDRQVKIRGYRVELNEIEIILTSLDTIEEAAVYTKTDENSLSICADVITNDSEITEKQILKSIRNLLPQQALPQEIKFINKIPRTSAGKVDYKLLTQ